MRRLIGFPRCTAGCCHCGACYAATLARTKWICAPIAPRNCHAICIAANAARCHYRSRRLCAGAANVKHLPGTLRGRRFVTHGRWIAWKRASSSAAIWPPGVCWPPCGSANRILPTCRNLFFLCPCTGAAYACAVTTRRWSWRNRLHARWMFPAGTIYCCVCGIPMPRRDSMRWSVVAICVTPLLCARAKHCRHILLCLMMFLRQVRRWRSVHGS